MLTLKEIAEILDRSEEDVQALLRMGKMPNRSINEVLEVKREIHEGREQQFLAERMPGNDNTLFG